MCYVRFMFPIKTWYFGVSQNRLLLLVWLVTCLQTNHHYITIYKDYVYSIPVYRIPTVYHRFFPILDVTKSNKNSPQEDSTTHPKPSKSEQKKIGSLRFEFCCPFRLGDGNSRSEWIVWRSGVNFNGPSVGYGDIWTSLYPHKCRRTVLFLGTLKTIV